MVSKTRMFFILLGGTIMNGVAGNFNNFGIISPYIASYFFQLDPSVRNSNFTQVPGIASISEALTTLIISYAIRYIRIYCLIWWISLSCCTIMFLSSYITNPLAFCWVYGLSLGSLSSCIFLPTLWLLWNHFPKQKGKISGIMLAGYSLGAVPFGLMFTYTVNPKSEKAVDVFGTGIEKMFGSNVTELVPIGIRFSALSYMLFILIGLYMIPKRMKAEKKPKKNSSEEFSLSNMLKNFKFWNLFLMVIIALTGNLYIQTLYKVIGINFINDDIFVSYVGVASFIFAAIGRIFFGFLLDRYNWKLVMCTNYLICAFLIGTFWYTLQSKLLFGLYIILYNFIGASIYNSILLQTDKAFPNDSRVISYVCLGFIPMYYSGYFFDALITPYVGYFCTFLINSAISVVATVQVVIHPETKKIESCLDDGLLVNS